MGAETPIYIVDDDFAVRDALSVSLGVLGYQHVVSFDTGTEFLEVAESLAPGCVLLDINLPGASGWEVQANLTRRGTFPVIMLTGDGDVGQAVRAMRHGAIDFLEKPFDVNMLHDALLLATIQLERRLSEELSSDVARHKTGRLSRREREVLVGLVQGRSNKMIAATIGLSPRTIEIYRAKLMVKLSVKSLSEAVRIALAAGFGDFQPS